MSEYLDKEGLRILINEIQSNVISSHVFENVRPSANDAIYILRIIPHSDKTDWEIRYKITTEVTYDSQTKQVSEVLLGGIGPRVAYYSVNNIVYDLGRYGVENHNVYGSAREIVLGLTFRTHFGQTHNISVEIRSVRGCDISYTVNRFSGTKLVSLPANSNGTVSDVFEKIVRADQLSKVAFTGSYNDLTDKPSLLDVSTISDDERLILFLKGGDKLNG